MLLPTKEIDPDQALLSVGATLISLLEAPATVSDLWERFRQHTRRTGCHARVTWSSLLVWCSSGQVVMAGRAGRSLALLSAWSMSVRCRSEVWDR